MTHAPSAYSDFMRSLLDGSGHRFDDLPEVQWKPNGRKYEVSALHIPEGRSVVRVKLDKGELGIAVQVRGTAGKVAGLVGTIVLYERPNVMAWWKMSDSLKNQLPQLYQEEHAPNCTKGMYFCCATCPSIPKGLGEGAGMPEIEWLKGILNGTDPLLKLSGPIIPIPAVNVPTNSDPSQPAPTGLRWVAAQIGRFFSAIGSLLAYLGNTLRSCCSRLRTA